MSRLLTLRASSIPTAFLCPASVRPPTLPIRESGYPADLGNACHEALRPLSEGDGVRWDTLPEIATRWGVKEDDLRILVALSAKLWPQIADTFTGALSEVALSVEIGDGVTLTGHVDFVAVVGNVARAADWKSGRKDSDYAHQMKAYGALLMLDDEAITEVSVTVVWIRVGEMENYTMTRADVEAWLADLVATVVRWDGVYRPGAHCGYCPRSHECEAATALVRRDVAALVDTGGSFNLDTMTADEIVSLVRKASMVAAYAERFRETVKARVESDGDIVASDGKRLTIATEERREVDTAKAWPVIDAVLTQDELAGVVDVRISKVEKVVAKNAGRGLGAKAVRDLAAALDAAGAIHTRAVSKMVERRG